MQSFNIKKFSTSLKLNQALSKPFLPRSRGNQKRRGTTCGFAAAIILAVFFFILSFFRVSCFFLDAFCAVFLFVPFFFQLLSPQRARFNLATDFCLSLRSSFLALYFLKRVGIFFCFYRVFVFLIFFYICYFSNIFFNVRISIFASLYSLNFIFFFF